MFGSAIAMYGEYILLGAKGKGPGDIKDGAAYLFHRDQGGTDDWGEVRNYVEPGENDYGSLGAGVALSSTQAYISTSECGVFHHRMEYSRSPSSPAVKVFRYFGISDSSANRPSPILTVLMLIPSSDKSTKRISIGYSIIEPVEQKTWVPRTIIS